MEIKCNYTEKPCPYPVDFDCHSCDVYKNAVLLEADAMKFEFIPKLKEYVFPSRGKADSAIDILHDLINESGYATLADWNDICGILSTTEDHKYRWTKPKIRTNVFHTKSASALGKSSVADSYSVEFIDMPEYYDDNTDSENNDPVNHPAHYTAGGIECIDAIAAALTSQNDPVAAWFTGQCLKYLWRWPLKNGLEDLKKTRFYLDRLIKYMEEK